MAATNRDGDAAALRAARSAVDAAKRALSERGPMWWPDGAPDLYRRLARDTPCAAWHVALEADAAADERFRCPRRGEAAGALHG